MISDNIEVIVVGGGQAGLALSYYLSRQHREHVVLEQARLAESWRTKRWDSLRLIAPNWSFELPGMAYSGDDPDGFMGKEEVADRIVDYASSFCGPVREGVKVDSVQTNPDGPGFFLITSDGNFTCKQVVIATGSLQRPYVPSLARNLPHTIEQIVPFGYRNPESLPPGAVLVVGSGQSGCQIAEELRRSGRDVYLSTSRSWGMPRRYRGRDTSSWTRIIGRFDRTVDDLPQGARIGLPTPQLTGSGGGHDLTVYTLEREGVVLMGRLIDIEAGCAHFADDLASNLAWSDKQSLDCINLIDEFVRKESPDIPEESFPPCLIGSQSTNPPPPSRLNLDDANIHSVVWATGYRPDFEWIRVPVFQDSGYPEHRRGVTRTPGLYFLGLEWLYKASSGFFAGVGDDAAYLASMIETTAMNAP